MVKKIIHNLRVTFGMACPDINCTGKMIPYDDRPCRDTCSDCGRTQRYFDELNPPKPGLLFKFVSYLERP